MKKILVIGSGNMDLTVHTDRMPSLGETVMGSDFATNAGGKGMNQANAVGKLGGDVSFLGAVGEDIYGDRLVKNLEKNNVKFEGIKTADVSTGIASITVIGGDNFIILNSGANACVTPEVIEASSKLIEAADFLIMQYEIPLESVICAAKLAKKYGTRVVINPAPYINLPDEFYSLVDIIVPNEHETELFVGINPVDEKSCIDAINKIRAKGIETAIITLGSRGCVYNSGDEILFTPAIKTTAVDTTSAGDSFIGALCCKLSIGCCLKDAIEYATKASSITVSRKGASDSIPTADEVEAFYSIKNLR